ncbi:response regulator transcription factor [Leptolyngbya sp. CCNP1308]|uniref:response regulator transcription factor n=1 Tax=Leptolyngbya sp. CCNP1308 TaxID=3110255 RepID=UPI002B1EB461|nr:response regulator transcription factor [Leptolyngbya sp. CCNP1308]MEA5448557.1 response regulator transcription factor [Leptolyngbya sp. CCNP1308]
MTTSQLRQQMLVVDDHDAVLNGTVTALQQDYPETDIRSARTAQEAAASLAAAQPALLVMDLSIPEQPGTPSQTETGIRLLRSLMQQYPELNIVVQSAHVKALVRLKPAIANHQGGFTIVDKNLPLKEMLIKVDWALQGIIYTPKDMRTELEVKPEWLQVLQLAFQEGLQDKAIAEQMNVSERTVRHYWTKVQDALDVYPDPGKNIRIQTQIRAREEGLID